MSPLGGSPLGDQPLGGQDESSRVLSTVLGVWFTRPQTPTVNSSAGLWWQAGHTSTLAGTMWWQHGHAASSGSTATWWD